MALIYQGFWRILCLPSCQLWLRSLLDPVPKHEQGCIQWCAQAAELSPLPPQRPMPYSTRWPILGMGWRSRGAKM